VFSFSPPGAEKLNAIAKIHAAAGKSIPTIF
jgi:hypothetical protein